MLFWVASFKVYVKCFSVLFDLLRTALKSFSNISLGSNIILDFLKYSLGIMIIINKQRKVRHFLPH